MLEWWLFNVMTKMIRAPKLLLRQPNEPTRTTVNDASPVRRLQDCIFTPSPVNVGRWTVKPQLVHDCAKNISYIYKQERRNSWFVLCRDVVLVEITHLLPSPSTPVMWFKLHQEIKRNGEEFCFEMLRPMQKS
jgi:hypothetical protein